VALAGMLAYASATSAGAGAAGTGRAAARGAEQKQKAWPSRYEGALLSFAVGAGPPPPPRTNRTRRVLHPVLIGHAASLTPY